ncbi:MAG: DinB family protein [Pirellulales bacterium]
MASVELEIGRAFLADAQAQLSLCRRRILHCVEQLNDDQLWWRAGEEYNSIANLLLHLEGNVRQRLLSLIGGAPDTRDRAAEFAERGPIAKEELAARFDATFQEAEKLLVELDPARLLETRTYKMLQGEVQGTFVTLILQTLVHVGGHAQEIITVTRLQLREGYRFLQEPAP